MAKRRSDTRARGNDTPPPVERPPPKVEGHTLEEWAKLANHFTELVPHRNPFRRK